MPTRCVAGNCSKTHKDGVSLFLWPENRKLSRLWEKAVQTKRPDFKATETSKLCSAHFKDVDFTDQTKLGAEVGIKYRPCLVENAVPTKFESKKIVSPDGTSEPEAKVRKLGSSTRAAYRKREAARVSIKTHESSTPKMISQF